MPSIARYLSRPIEHDALKERKMAFISGPRQVGKSTVAKSLLAHKENYFLYDDERFRRKWSRSPLDALEERSTGIVALDEIHKDRFWKRKLKGIYDTIGDSTPLIVTGSARLDTFRKGSDSLLGRYIPYRLHPFSVAESTESCKPDVFLKKPQLNFKWEDLLTLGGFPEPLLRGEEGHAQRWSRLRIDRLVLEDSRDLLNISDQNAFRLLIDLLPERVGSLLSINALREDLSKNHATVKSWLEVLDILYFTFLVKPYSKRLRRMVKAEPKLYLYDILRIHSNNKGKRLENLTALHLLKACHYWTDLAYGEFDLHFARTKDGLEIDFLIVRDGNPWIAVECKSGEKTPSRALVALSERLKVQHRFQLVTDKSFDKTFAASNVRVMNYEKFFSGLI